jgi:hypothetical protein
MIIPAKKCSVRREGERFVVACEFHSDNLLVVMEPWRPEPACSIATNTRPQLRDFSGITLRPRYTLFIC